MINPRRVGDSDFESVAGGCPLIGPSGDLGLLLTVEEESEHRPVSKIALVYQSHKDRALYDSPPRFPTVGADNVILESIGPSEGFGVSDPIVIHAGEKYYMFYLAKPHHPGIDSFIGLAISGTPEHASGWQRMGSVLPEVGTVTSATVSPPGVSAEHPHVMLYSTPKRCGLMLASSVNLLLWETEGSSPVLECRRDRFDSHGILASATPRRISTGEWLWLYTGIDSNGKGSIGAVISSTSVIKDIHSWTARPTEPILSASYASPWESDSIRVMGLTRAGNGSQDVFDVYYTGALEPTEVSSVGHARIEVINHRVKVSYPTTAADRVVAVHQSSM